MEEKETVFLTEEERHRLKSCDDYLNTKQIRKIFAFNIQRYLVCMPGRKRPNRDFYPKALVEALLLRGDVRSYVRKERRKREERAERQRDRDRRNAERREKERLQRIRKKEIKELLSSYGPDQYQKRASELDRVFHLHVGPTNSGKTHDAMEALAKADSGLYLGPLRLLALEMFDRLNNAGVRCNLLTGEEEESVPGATITASTIELCDFRGRYDVAIIDEAQMIADPSRGSHWTKALLLVNAREVHVCMAPQALDLVTRLLDGIPAPYEIHRHERLVPLVFSGSWKELKDIEPGDAVIAFSRRQVLNIAAHLERMGVRASVIYGSLPPVARREEVRRFAAKETTVAVATDAIGMGISLPIRRILFFDVEKYDGTVRRELYPEEIQQIAGRAGRFGMYDLGEVLTMADAHHVRVSMEAEIEPIRRMVIPFPREVLNAGYPLGELIEGWGELPDMPLFDREDLTEALILYETVRDAYAEEITADPELAFDLITCPVNVKEDKLVGYWRTCVSAVFSGRKMPEPHFPLDSLENCELQYHAYDIYHQLSRRIREPVSVLEKKDAVCRRINELLKTDKTEYLLRCRVCGKRLPWNSPYYICDRCYAFAY